MTFIRTLISGFVLLHLLAGAGWAQAPEAEDLRRLFLNPPADCRIMMRWWWFGPAVSKRGLEREMRLMKEAGIGGFEVQPVYPLALDDAAAGIRNIPYLSDDFIEALRFTEEGARELGLRVDLTLGSGWPFGGPHIPIGQSAARLRVERVPAAAGSRRIPAPHISEGETLIAVFLARQREGGVAPDSLSEVSDVRDGAAWLPAAASGPQVVLFFISSRTGMTVKRAAVGAEGFVLDHYSRAALDTHLKAVGDRLLQAFGSRRPRAVFCDSLEVFGADWTPDFPEQFRKRRGYDIKPHLAALALDMGAQTKAVRQDWGKTLTELADERFIAPLHEWATRNGTLFRMQSYGQPPAELSSNVNVDLPEGEGAEWRSLSASRWASSAGHLYGKPVISSETWTWLHSPSFRASPLDIKAEADRHFLQGINQLIGHGWPYTPEGVAYPGWRFYAAAAFSEKNPWWNVMPDVALYLQRVTCLMRQGRPANDIAIYLSNSDGWADLEPGRTDLFRAERALLGPELVGRVLDAGYGADFIDDAAIEKLGRVANGALNVGSNQYRAVILPNVESMPPSVLGKLAEFAQGGGALIATRRKPELAPGLMASDEERSRLRELARALFDGPSAPARFVADESQGLAAELNRALRPDVQLSPAAPEIGFVHRSAEAAEIYFLANTGNTPVSVKAAFRVAGLEPEWWDPLTGSIRAAEVAGRSRTGVTVSVSLEPYGSRALVFSRQRSSAPAARPHTAVASVDVSGGWDVSFGGKTVRMETLRSWSDAEDTRYYSGVAVYERDVVVPGALLAPGLDVRLDFGEGKPTSGGHTAERMQAGLEAPVREAAIIYVNGVRAGSVWCPPYAIDVTTLLRPGANRFKILVANLAINHMAGQAKPDYRLLNLRYGERFKAQDMDNLQPLPSGLLGPIRLTALKQ